MNLSYLHVAGGRITLGTRNGGPFGQGSGPIHLDVVVCAGDERALIDCGHTDIGGVLEGHCTHTTDAGVICGRPICLSKSVLR